MTEERPKFVEIKENFKMTQQSSQLFIVGETYADRLDKYKVISLSGNRIVFEYTDGRRFEGDAKQKALIYQNILLEKKGPRQAQPRTSLRSYNNSLHAFTHEDIFPIIAKMIEKLYSQSRDYVTHDKIVIALLKQPEAEPFLAGCPTDESRTTAWWAHNMVAWFSKVFTDGRSDWNSRFERAKIDGKWAYRVHE
jgi:hypothetical protein